MNFESMLLSLAGQFLSSPNFWQMLEQQCTHNVFNVCQDVLEAAEHGHISKQKALEAITLLLSDQPAQQLQQTPLDTRHMLEQIYKLRMRA